MRTLVCTGFWWLPGKEDRPVAGTLRVSPGGDLRLSLIGELKEQEEFDEDKRHRIILGSVDDSPRGNDVTLVGCALMGTRVGSYHGGREEYSAARAFFGAHLTRDEDFRFRCALLTVSGLTEWAHSLSGLHHASTPLPTARNAGQTVPIATYRVPIPPSGRLPDATVTLNFGVSSKSAAQTFKFREEANLLFTFDAARTADEINGRYIYPLQNLMTFVSDRPQKVENVSVWRAEDLTDWERNPEIRLVGHRVQPGEEKRKVVRNHEMLLTLADVDFVTFLEKWLQLADRFAEVFNIYFGIQYGPPSYVDMTYALVAQSLSLYYARSREGVTYRREEERRFRDLLPMLQTQDAEWLVDQLGLRPYPSFRSMLHGLVERHGAVLDPILANRRDAFVNQAASTLRFIERREAEERGAASHGPELYWLARKLHFLIKSCFLAELGFGPDKISHFFSRSDYFQYISRLEAERESNKPAPKEVNISFQFIVPTDAVLDAARKLAASESPDERAIGTAVLELTDITNRTKSAVEDAGGRERFDLAVYLDYKFGISLEAADRLKASLDKEVRYVAETLIRQSEAVATSKMAVLQATKRG